MLIVALAGLAIVLALGGPWWAALPLFALWLAWTWLKIWADKKMESIDGARQEEAEQVAVIPDRG